MAENINSEAVQAGLKAAKVLRSCVGDLFKTLAEGGDDVIQRGQQETNNNNGDQPEKVFISYVQNAVGNIGNRLRELESACTLLAHSNAQVNLSLGNSTMIAQDMQWERTNLYASMVNSYRWNDRLSDFAGHASSFLSQNSLKRATPNPQVMIRGRLVPTTIRPNVYSVQKVDAICLNLKRLFTDMSIDLIRPFGAPAVLKITLERVFKAVVVIRGTAIEWVMVKGFQEDFVGQDGKMDIWSESRYEVFRKVTDHANAAMLHFYSPVLSDLALRSFITWLRSYSSLFSKPCRKCDRRLLNNMPPTWRDVRTLEIYHEICRP
ncbi:Mediator of RNA polymerase II transcription subunit 27 [Halotydeus destructor]|nr:Mediator of RNA polymerase II transcription subunit 27 [Halotydeus destructor]